MQNQQHGHIVSVKLKRYLRNSAVVIGLAAIAGSAPNASAAELKEVPSDNGGDVIIMLEGEIESGDDEKFRAIAAKHSNAIVFLNSQGGAIAPAMDIGRTVKLRGYKTAVTKSSICASACALIWVSGSRRVLFQGGEVGFHASYLDTDGTKLETGLGNALVGRYLTQLGYGEKTVIFATFAPPDDILWLNDSTASLSGIDFDRIGNSEASVKKPSVKDTPMAPPVVTTSANDPIARELNKVAAEIQPRQLDETTMLEGAEANGRTITYRHSILRRDGSDEELIKFVNKTVVPKVCQQPEMRSSMDDYGIKYRYQYTFPNQAIPLTVEVTSDLCKQLSK